MLSFRNRLLILLIGLVVSAETVTLFTALARTKANEQNRAREQLVAGAHIGQQLLAYREKQLANAVAVLSSDWAFRQAIGSGERATAASALANNATRIGADVSLALDLNGKVVARGDSTAVMEHELVAVATRHDSNADGSEFVVTPTGAVYQVVTAPILAPEEIGRVVLGFAVDQKLASELYPLVGVDVAFFSGGDDARKLVASTLNSLADGDFVAKAPVRVTPDVTKIDDEPYLATLKQLSTHGPQLDIALFKPMDEVMAPYHKLARQLGLIIGITIAAAVAAGIYLGRSAARPVLQLAAGAARVAAGDYSGEVQGASGGRELADLARAFNTMQTGIAERETRLLHQARHDSATGLPNRLFAEEWLTQHLAELAPEQQLGVVLLAVTNLREVSAGLGFNIAGELVRHLASSLGGLSGEHGLVARVDATHFVVAAAPLAEHEMDTLLTDVRLLARRPLATAGITLQAAVVLGAALAPRHGQSATELLRCAEAALETAIQQKLPQSMFERASDAAQRRALQLGADLPAALLAGQLYLQYQPKFRVGDRTPRGVEALLRWQHPEFGNVSPAEFIPIAERTGASGLVTRWVLRHALSQLSKWQREGINIDVAVNLSAADIVDPGMLEYILGVLRDAKLATSALTLEITESVLLHEPEVARRNMEMLRIAGVRFSIDDFGTGYSSLSQLRQLSADELKIDQSFVRTVTMGSEHAAVIRAIVELGHGLGLRTVAEGVEEESQWRLLAELGCDYVQGYLTGRPQSAEELTPQLSTSRDADDTRTAALRVLELRRREER